MDRRTLLGSLAALPVLQWLPAAARGKDDEAAADKAFATLRKSKSEWKDLLEPARYKILFEEATERPGSSALNQETRTGTFVCAACYLPMFDAQHKYESGTGWPSFTQPLEGHIDTKKDFKLIWPRTEYHCGRCGGHQGHVFDDGPRPRGERWCNNGLALLFIPEAEALPALRT